MKDDSVPVAPGEKPMTDAEQLAAKLAAARVDGKRLGVHKVRVARSKGSRANRRANWDLGLDVDRNGMPFAWVESRGGPIDFSAARILEDVGKGFLRKAGIGFSGPPTIDRVDLATDIEFDVAGDAQDVLRAFAALLVRGHKISVVHAKASRVIETVSWLGSRNRVQLRIYDKTAQEATWRRRKQTPRERVLRIEREFRPKPCDPWTVERLAADDLSREVTQPLRIPSEHSLVVTGLRDADAAFRERTRDRRADVPERLMGTAVRAYLEGREGWDGQTRATRYVDLETYGVWLDPESQRSIDLGKILAEVQAAWKTWGQ